MLPVVALFLQLSGPSLAGQTPASVPRPGDYPHEPIVIERELDRLVYQNDGTGNRSSSARVRVQSEAGVRQYGLIIFAYASANETPEVEYVRVLKPDGTQVITPPESVQDLPADVTRAAPFYSDLRVKHVAVRGLAPGDVVEYSFRARIHTPQVPGHFWMDINFERDQIILEQQVELDVPRDRTLKVSAAGPKPAVREEAGRRIYTWKSSNLARPPERAEDKRKRKKAEKPAPLIRVSSFQSWEDLGRWYGDLQRDRLVITPAVQAKADELTRNLRSDAEKRTALYRYVAMQFRYIGIAFGVGRYQPHAAAEVLANQYGDCKDKHTLLAALLKAAGITAFPALAHSTRELDADVPSPSQFDHLITALPQAASFDWLDTTLEMAPYGYLGAPMRDSQVLVIPEGAPARLVKTPAEPPFRRREEFRSTARLDTNGTLEGEMEYKLRGDGELLLRVALRNTPQHQWQEIVQQLSQISGFGGTVSAVEVSPLEEIDAPLRIRYHYTRKDYSDWENQRTSPPLPRMGLAPLDEDAPEGPLDLPQPGELIYESRMKLPEGFTVRPPPPRELEASFAEYHGSYDFRDGELEAKRHLVIKSTKLAVTDRKAYSDFQKALNDYEFAFLTLRTGAAPELAISTEESEEAKRLREEARAAFGRRDLQQARDFLEKALAADPGVSEAWMLLGVVHMTSGDMQRGLEALRKEVALHPRNTMGLKTLAFALMSMGLTDEAATTWSSLIKVDPNDRDAPANLGNLLLSQKRHQEAVSALESAVALNPKSEAILTALSRAYLAAGSRAKGVETLRKAAELSPGPELWNNLAYELADAGLELDLALEYAQKAVQSTEEATASIRLDRLQPADLQKMNTLSSYWDTFGWVHFRKSNLDLAEQYLEAAWGLRQDPVIADHLGQVYARQGKRLEAIRMYASALAAPTSQGSLETRGRLEKLAGSIRASDTAIDRARSGLGQQRMIKLKRIVTGRASGEFWLLLSRGPKVEDVRFISGDPRLQAATKDLLAATFPARIPGNVPVRLVRRGILSCYSVVAHCDFILMTTDTVRGLE